MRKLLNCENLTKGQTYELFCEFQQYTIEKQSAILALFRSKKETLDEILGALEYFNSHSKTINHNYDVVDIVGTGGDGSGTFNISTAASLVVASCNVFVAKHGGRSATSKSGSQDVVQALGIKVAKTGEECLELLQRHYYTYLFAPLFNEELKKYGELRRKLGFPTLFNVLGPLLNPLHPKKCVIGVYRRDLVQKVGDVLKSQGVKHALVVHSDDGLDEISISSNTHVLEIKDGTSKEYSLNPEYFGLHKVSIAEVQGGDASENANLIKRILSNEIKGPKQDIVLLNAAAGLYVSGRVLSIAEGIIEAKYAIEKGKAYALLNKIKEVNDE